MRLTVLLAGLLAVGACAPVPITGREQLSLVSDSTVQAAADREFSKFIGAARSKSALVTGSESPQAAAALAMVQRAGNRVIDASGLRGARNWEIHLVKSNEPNAFVTPNGKIVVFTGLLPVTQTEAALAGVLGHEVAHVIARHSAERMSHELAANLAVAAAATAASAASKDRNAPAAMAAVVGLGMQYGLILPYSRAHESEADHIGLFLAAKAGYDPAEFAGVWQRMAARGGGSRWEFAATHPSHATRQAQIAEWLPEAMLFYAEPTRPLPTSLAEVQAARTTRDRAAALAPLGMKPTWDDGWTYQVRQSDRTDGSDRTVRIEHRASCRVAPPCIVHVVDSGEESIYGADLALVETRSAGASGAASTRFDPPLITAQFPLRVGDTWSQRVTLETDTRRQPIVIKGDVVAYESVTVPAGSFMAFKIVLSANGVRFRETWWAPETRVPARIVSYSTRGPGSASIDLVSFPPAEDPGAIVEASAD